jgi:hypothetical protein
MRGSDCAGLTFALPATTHAPLAQQKPTPVCREPSCDAPVQIDCIWPSLVNDPNSAETATQFADGANRARRPWLHQPPASPPTGCRRPSRACICARARQTGQELARGGKVTHAPEPPTPSTTAPRGDGSPTGKLSARGSPNCNRNPHTTPRIAARWPPLPASEASGCAPPCYGHALRPIAPS